MESQILTKLEKIDAKLEDLEAGMGAKLEDLKVGQEQLRATVDRNFASVERMLVELLPNEQREPLIRSTG